MADVQWADEALESLARIYADIAADQPGAAARFVRRLREAGDSLELLPSRGRPIAGGLRELTNVAPYLIRYAYDPGADLVTILIVWRGAQQAP